MKTAGEIGFFAAGLCAIAVSACIGLVSLHGSREHGQYGKTLEFRVSALNTEHFDQFNRAPEGVDAFSSSQAREIAQSGKAPEGFQWLPVSSFFLMETGGGIDPRGILSVINGRKSLLVADRPEMILTHTTRGPQWGVKSVEFSSTNIYGPTVEYIDIDLDSTGTKMLRQFTQKYIRHSVALIVDGQAVANFGLLTPMRRGSLRISYPEGGRHLAEQLRDALKK